jgi:hypothetical protein
MKYHWEFFAGLFGLCCLGSGAVGATADAEKPAASAWLSDWQEGRKAARTSGKPLFVVFRCRH